MTTGASVTFLTVWKLVVEAIPTSMRCQYTSNIKMGFGHRLCCYDNSNGHLRNHHTEAFCIHLQDLMYDVFSRMKCVEAQTGIICLFLIYHCHSNRNILSPILPTRSDNIVLC